MGALAIPKRMALTKTNGHLCARLGVKFNGKDMGTSVIAYDLERGTVTVKDYENGSRTLKGKVEAYWR